MENFTNNDLIFSQAEKNIYDHYLIQAEKFMQGKVNGETMQGVNDTIARTTDVVKCRLMGYKLRSLLSGRKQLTK